MITKARRRSGVQVPLESPYARVAQLVQSAALIRRRSWVQFPPLVPTADAVFISFHVRSWGLRPKKYSPLCIQRDRAVRQLTWLITKRSEVQILLPQPLRSGAGVARQPHKLKVGGSNPPSRTQGTALPFSICDVLGAHSNFFFLKIFSSFGRAIVC